MIGTIESKQQQLANGYFQSGTGPEKILILGSCRTLAYLSYLIRWNETGGQNQFTIRRMDPCDWTVSNVDLGSLETDERILSAIRETDIFIHEHLESYGMFNTTSRIEKNIYRFGMNPKQGISIPNFHDRMVLEKDYEAFGVPLPENYVEAGEAALEKFGDVCRMSSFPEMADHFRENWRTTRFFWRPNHVSAAFTLYIFRCMNIRFLHLGLSDDFWAGAETEDLFKNPHTVPTQRDIEAYGLKWSEL